MTRFPTGEELEKPLKCEHPDHVGFRYKDNNLYLHSSKLYAFSIYREEGRLYFWACDRCCDRDYKKRDMRLKITE